MFYLVFPAILLLVPRPQMLAAAVGLSYIVAGMTNIALRKLGGTPAGEALAFPFWPVQFPVFASGCWLATLPPAGARARVIALWMFSLAAAGLTINSQLRGHSNLLVAVALLTVLAWATGVGRPRWLQAQPLIFLGRISFSFYIVHFAVLGLIHPLVPSIETSEGAGIALMVVMALMLAIAGGISAYTFRRIKQPVIIATHQIGRRGTG